MRKVLSVSIKRRTRKKREEREEREEKERKNENVKTLKLASSFLPLSSIK